MYVSKSFWVYLCDFSSLYVRVRACVCVCVDFTPNMNDFHTNFTQK